MYVSLLSEDTHTELYARSVCRTQLAKMSFDKTFDLSQLSLVCLYIYFIWFTWCFDEQPFSRVTMLGHALCRKMSDEGRVLTCQGVFGLNILVLVWDLCDGFP